MKVSLKIAASSLLRAPSIYTRKTRKLGAGDTTETLHVVMFSAVGRAALPLVVRLRTVDQFRVECLVELFAKSRKDLEIGIEPVNAMARFVVDTTKEPSSSKTLRARRSTDSLADELVALGGVAIDSTADGVGKNLDTRKDAGVKAADKMLEALDKLKSKTASISRQVRIKQLLC